MESHQLNNEDLSNDAIIELLTLDCKIFSDGTKVYFNKEGKCHRMHGPAVIRPDNWQYWGTREWFNNGMRHREDGPAMEYADGKVAYYINDKQLTKEQFILWQQGKFYIQPNS